jgi:hypothetical protein
MKRITFLAALIVSLMSFSAAKAQVTGHIGINIGSPGYYGGPVYREPRRVVVVERPVYRRYPVREVYYDRPVVVRRGYYRPGPRFYGHPGRGYGRGHRRW